MTPGLYHGGGVGGGPGPGVCGSLSSSRARRFHFPGCPGVNIRVSARLPPRRAAATFLPRPGRARARPPRSRLSANERAGPRRSPSMERGSAGRSAGRGSEGRGLPAGRGAAARRVGGVGGAGWGSGRSAAAPRVLELTPGEGFRPHPDAAVRSGAAEAGGGRGTVPPGWGCGRHWGCEGSVPPRPTRGTRPFPRRTRNWCGPRTQPSETVVSEPEMESQRCRLLRVGPGARGCT